MCHLCLQIATSICNDIYILHFHQYLCTHGYWHQPWTTTILFVMWHAHVHVDTSKPTSTYTSRLAHTWTVWYEHIIADDNSETLSDCVQNNRKNLRSHSWIHKISISYSWEMPTSSTMSENRWRNIHARTQSPTNISRWTRTEAHLHTKDLCYAPKSGKLQENIKESTSRKTVPCLIASALYVALGPILSVERVGSIPLPRCCPRAIGR